MSAATCRRQCYKNLGLIIRKRTHRCGIASSATENVDLKKFNLDHVLAAAYEVPIRKSSNKYDEQLQEIDRTLASTIWPTFADEVHKSLSHETYKAESSLKKDRRNMLREVDPQYLSKKSLRVDSFSDRGGLSFLSERDAELDLKSSISTVYESDSVNREHKDLQRAIFSRIRTLGKRKDWKEALHELERAVDQQIPITDYMYNGVMTALAISGKWELALEMLNRLTQDKIPISLDVYNSAINACARGYAWREALKLLNSMSTHGPEPDIITYSCAVNACSKCGNSKIALSLLRRAEKLGLQLTQSIYNSAMMACMKSADYEKVEMLFLEMQRKGIEPDEVNYYSLFQSFLRRKKSNQMLNLLADLETGNRSNLTINLYNCVLQMCSESLWSTKAITILDTMRRLGIHPNLASYTYALKSCTGVSSDANTTKIMMLIEDMKNLNIQPDGKCYSYVITACSNSGQLNESLDLLSNMLRPTVTDVTPLDASTAIHSVLDACARSGEYETSIDLLQKAHKLGLMPRFGFQLLEKTIESCANAGKPGKCLKMIEEYRNRGICISSTMLTNVMKGYAMRGMGGDWELCVKLLSEIPSKYGFQPEIEAFRYAAEACRNARKWDEARDVDSFSNQSSYI